MKNRQVSSICVVHILATFNNTIITVSEIDGSVILWSSSGSNGFKGSKKSTPHAAQVTSESIAKKIKKMGVKTISVRIRGPGNGRESSIRGLMTSGINITSIKDITSVPHNGCRPPKKRRIWYEKF